MLHPDSLKLICEREGYLKKIPDGRVVPYLCPAGVATIGFGSIWRLDGSRVEMTDPPIGYEAAMQLMGRELQIKCEPAVDRMITVKLHPLSRGALVSFVYNVGDGALRSSGLRRAINDRRFDDVPGEFAKWRMGGGRVLRGLVLRREAEAAMFLRGVRLAATPSASSRPALGGWVVTVAKAA